MKGLAFTTFSFGPLYAHQQRQMRDSILKVYPDANMEFFVTEDPSSTHPDGVLPKGARTHHESEYGWKVHCVKHCKDNGYKQVIFMDAAVTLQRPLDDVLALAKKHGVLATVGGATLENVTSDKCLSFIGKTRKQVEGWKLVGGSIYVFDFTNPVAEKVFNYWHNLEINGMFGSEPEHARGEVQGHRKDETCMSVALYEYGVPIVGYDEIGYHNMGLGSNNELPFVFYKLHGRDIITIHGHSFVQHLIPIYGAVLNLGCRDFIFSDWCKAQEYEVHCVDIGDFEGDYDRLAIGHYNGRVGVSKERESNLDATHVIEGDEVEMVTLEEYSRRKGVNHWDLICMDIEDSEYEILKQAKHPIAGQISVEFHHHLGRSKEDLDSLLDYLSEWYVIRNRVWEEGHGSGFNYWDVLLIAKQ